MNTTEAEFRRRFQEAALKFESLARAANDNDELPVLTDAELKELSEIFQCIRRNLELRQVTNSLEDLKTEHGPKIRLLTRLMSRLMRERVGPFPALQDDDPPWEDRYKHLDWTKLPPRLKYLGQYAEKYGLLRATCNDERIADMIDDKTRNELNEVGDRIRLANDCDEIFHWFENFRGQEPPEASLIQGLIEALAELGIRYE